jgi:uncharacterized peroxidase-related enzyme
MVSHAEFLRRVTLDEAMVAALCVDYRTAPISAAERAMLDYAVDISEDATRVSRETLDGLRAQGFDDRAILQMALIASWFNYINRVADALGVGRDDMATSCTLPSPAPAPWAASPIATVVP